MRLVTKIEVLNWAQFKNIWLDLRTLINAYPYFRPNLTTTNSEPDLRILINAYPYLGPI